MLMAVCGYVIHVMTICMTGMVDLCEAEDE